MRLFFACFARLPAVLLALGFCISAGMAQAQPWNKLQGTEQQVLQPLQAHWDKMEKPRQQKWREIAKKYPTMSAEEQIRTRERMVEWSKLPPAQQQAARTEYKTNPAARDPALSEKWQAYQQMTPEQKTALAKKAETEAQSKANTPPKPTPRPLQQNPQ